MTVCFQFINGPLLCSISKWMPVARPEYLVPISHEVIQQIMTCICLSSVKCTLRNDTCMWVIWYSKCLISIYDRYIWPDTKFQANKRKVGKLDSEFNMSGFELGVRQTSWNFIHAKCALLICTVCALGCSIHTCQPSFQFPQSWAFHACTLCLSLCWKLSFSSHPEKPVRLS